jgi:hypothetical protein
MSHKRVFILLEDLFEDLGFCYPHIRMGEAGHEVVSVAPSSRSYHGKNGLEASGRDLPAFCRAVIEKL